MKRHAKTAMVLAALEAAALGGYEIEAFTAGGLVTRGKVLDLSAEAVEIAGHALFGWGYNTLLPWREVLHVRRYEPGVEAAVEIVKRRAAEAEERGGAEA